jgi:hypothetical protein
MDLCLVSYDSEKKAIIYPKHSYISLYTAEVNACSVKEKQKILYYEEENWAAKD